MEIGDNAEKPSTTAANASATVIVSSTIVHCTSQPTMPSSCCLDDEPKEDENDGGAGGDRIEPGTSPQSHHMKKRRVSFAASTQLAQYLEPINPFQKLGEYNEKFAHTAAVQCTLSHKGGLFDL